MDHSLSDCWVMTTANRIKKKNTTRLGMVIAAAKRDNNRRKGRGKMKSKQMKTKGELFQSPTHVHRARPSRGPTGTCTQD